MISALVLSLDRTHYSLYEQGRETITATVVPTGDPGDSYTVTLTRETAGVPKTLATETLTVAAGQSGQPKVVTFNLKGLVNEKGYRTARFSQRPGDYAVTVASGDVTMTKTLTVTPITVETMKRDYLGGLSLQTVEQLMVRVQPQSLTGVEVLEVSALTQRGPHSLVYVGGASKSLAWNGGTAVVIPASGTYTLMDTMGEFIEVVVDFAALPASNANESLYIDYGRMSDDTIIRQILTTTADVERAIHTFLEPTEVAAGNILDTVLSSSIPASPDVIGDAMPYYRPHHFGKWLSIKLPYHNVLDVYRLSGWFNRDKTVEIGQDWITVTEKSGLVELVPSNAALVNYTFYGPLFLFITSHADVVPQFWSYHILTGLREIPVPVWEFIGKRAAISLLTQAGQARNPTGATARSLSRDGVSESRSLGQDGLYSATIKQYERETGRQQDGTEKLLLSFRLKYAGMSVTVL